MVYEGRKRRYSSGRRTGGKKEKSGGGFLSFCLWALFIALAVGVFFPEAAEKVRQKARDLVGADYGGAVRVFGEGLGEGKGIAAAAKEAFARAFGESGGADTPDVENPGDSELVNSGEGEALPAINPDEDKVFEDEPTDEKDAVAAFMASLGEFSELDVPERATYEMPELPIELSVPVSGVISSRFGYRRAPSDGQVRFHYGLDLAAEEGRDVLCAADGVVTAVGDSTTYGLYVIVKHDSGAETIYAHLSGTDVEDGQSVLSGDKLGTVGATGNATAPCLHFELLIDGRYVNPEYYLKLKDG